MLRQRQTGPGRRRIGINDGNMIDISGLRLSLSSDAGAVNILHGIDLKVAAKESLGIVGPSGSGKTSLMLLIAGLEQPAPISASCSRLSISSRP
jgi:predicted ABC-type transport system involved in lysophospholipase L1 biosynthesis ATPase subunit